MKAIVPIELNRIEFENAYRRIYKQCGTNWGAKWGRRDVPLDTSRVWRKGRPASVIGYKRGEAVALTVVLEVGQLPGGALRGRLMGTPVGVGDPAFEFVSDDHTLTSNDELRISVTGQAPLPNWPTKLERSVEWTFWAERDGERRPKTLCTSGPHTILVTFNAPLQKERYEEGDPRKYEDGGTIPRMEEATKRAEAIGPTDAVDFIRQLFKKFPRHVLKFDHLPSDKKRRGMEPKNVQYRAKVDWPSFLHVRERTEGTRDRRLQEQGGVWPLADLEEFSGECQAVVRFICAVLRQLGFQDESVEDSVAIRFVTAHAETPYQPVIGSSPVHCKGPPRSRYQYALADHPVENRLYRWAEIRQDIHFNKFEAFLRYRYRKDGEIYQAWYSGGAAELQSAEKGIIGNTPQREEGDHECPEDRLSAAFRRTLLNAFSALVEYEEVKHDGENKVQIIRHWSYGEEKACPDPPQEDTSFEVLD